MKEMSEEKLIKDRAKELKKEEKERKKEEKERKKIAQKRISKLIKKGSTLVLPERVKGWKNFVKQLLNDADVIDVDPVETVNLAINIMERLENGATMDEAIKNFLFSDLDKNAMGLAETMISSFSKQGVDFFGAMMIKRFELIDKKASGEREEKSNLEEAHIAKKDEKINEERIEDEQGVLRGVEQKQGLQKEIATIDAQIEQLKQRRRELETTLIETQDGLDEK